ncbi:MAG TPA: helix-turn-helix domain-containing protein [Solirubrobacterales bacterium]|jgi:DNA-binding HxlR family transcriptional regulator
MSRRNYGQACSLAGALDRIGERWSLLIVRQLLLGPLRFSDLARGVGGAPTDVLTKRLRDMEADGIIRRRELGPPASAVVYELTELGRELDGPLIELGRWGMNFFRIEQVAEIEARWLPTTLRVILRPPAEASMTVQLRSEGHDAILRIAGGSVEAERGEAFDPDLTLEGSPRDILAVLVAGDAAAGDAQIGGDPEALEQLRSMVVLPDRLLDDAIAVATDPAALPLV